MKTITIKDREYPVLADLGTLLLMGLKYNLEFWEIQDRLSNIAGDRMSIKFFQTSCWFVISCIERGIEESESKIECTLTDNQVMAWIGSNLPIVAELYRQCMGLNAEEGSKNVKAPETEQK